MTKFIAQTYTLTHGYRATITYALIGFSAFLALVYSVNVYTVVSRTVAIRQAAATVSDVSSEVHELDARYLSLTNDITPEMAAQRGMVPGEVSAYISRTPTLGMVALRGNEF